MAPKAKQAFARWPLRIICFVVVLYLAVALIAAVAWFAFGRKAEDQVVDLALGLTEITGIVLVPVLLIGLIAVPLYCWLTRKFVDLL
jgi:hypothetical protein